ncbi:MAG: ATPase domain-containing protein [Halorientalis sp.]
MSKLYELGLDDHDQLANELGGGIPRGSIVLIEGNYGAGKSVLSQRFTYGFQEEGYAVTFVSTELNMRGFLDQMYDLDYEITLPVLDEEVLFLPAEVGSSGEGIQLERDNEERKELLNRLMEAEVLWQGDVVIVDTFDSILRNDPTFEALVRQNDERQAALEIISHFREMTGKNKTIVLTVDPSNINSDSIAPFRSIADVYFQLQMIEVGNDVRRNISVKRFAGMGDQVGDTIGYSVRSGIGVVIESRSVA